MNHELKTHNQAGIAHILLLILLVAGIGLGIYLVQNRTNIFPRASISGPIAPKTGFTLITTSDVLPSGSEFEVKVNASSDFDAANLFTLIMNYPADKVQVLEIFPGLGDAPSITDTFIKKWIEQTDDKNGKITLSGAIPNPGFRTNAGSPGFMAGIRFKVLASSGIAVLSVNDESGIYRNSDNQNIINASSGTEVKIGVAASPGEELCQAITCPMGAPVGCEYVGAFTSTCDPAKYDELTCGKLVCTGSPTPTPSCNPRPACLDANPRCLIPVTSDMCPPPAPTPTPLPPAVDGKRADLFKDSKKPNFVNDQDISVFYSKCAEKGIELFGQPASVQPICDIFEDGKITVQDWAVLIKFRNSSI